MTHAILDNHTRTLMKSPVNPSSRLTRAGFTIIELLVVVAIIGILLSLVSVGLSQAGQAARQTAALSNLKQVGTAWMQYANQNDDRCMLGFVDEAAQAALRIRASDAAGDPVATQFATTYPFRLLPFLNNDRTLMYDYINEYEDISIIPPDVIASNPCFGYNAYYLGGWWTTVGGLPTMTFGQSPQNPVTRSTSQIERTTEMVVFCASTPAEPGFVKSPNEFAVGSAWVVPHTLAQTPIWQASDGGTFQTIDATAALASAGDSGVGQVIASLLASNLASNLARNRAQHQVQLTQGGSGMDVLAAQSVPLRRIKNVVQTVRADLSTTTQGLRDLMDQRRWINAANHSTAGADYTHAP